MNSNYTDPLPDSLFERGDVPMTKEEVRTLVLSKLMLTGGSTIIDVGAGTGSVSVASARIADRGRVYAIEKNDRAVDLINKNIKKFAVPNVTVIHGEAPGILENAGTFDRAFVGGSGGNLQGILAWIDEHIDENGVIVSTAITLDTLIYTRGFFNTEKYALDIIHVAVTRIGERGTASMFSALTPVYIITAKKVKR